jgi:hypothetical protein
MPSIDIPFKSPIDMNRFEVKTHRLENRSTTFSSPLDGMLYFDTNTGVKQIRYVVDSGAGVDADRYRYIPRDDLALTVTGLWTFDATGAPFAVGSATKITNLNADLLDGYDTSQSTTGNTVAVRNSDGTLTVQDPLDPTDALNLRAGRALLNNGDDKRSVRAGAITALPSHGFDGNTYTASANGVLPDFDGVTLVDGDIAALFYEGGGGAAYYQGSAHALNGMVEVVDVGSVGTPWILQRLDIADTRSEVTAGMFFFVSEGTELGNSKWALVNDDPVYLRVDAPNALVATPAAGGSLTPSTTYYYRITAVDSGGEMATELEVSAATDAGTNLTIDLSWDAFASATSYKIYRSTVSDTYGASSYVGTTTALTFSDTGIALTTGAPPTATTLQFYKFDSNSFYQQGNGIVLAGDSIHFAQSSDYTTGGLFWASGAATVGHTAALSGILQGNGTSAPTAILPATTPNVTVNKLPKFSSTAPFLTDSTITDDGAEVRISPSGSVRLDYAGTTQFYTVSAGLEGYVTGSARIVNAAASATVPTLLPSSSTTNTGIGSVTTTLHFITDGTSRWSIPNASTLTGNGASTIATSSGALTLAPASGSNLEVTMTGVGYVNITASGADRSLESTSSGLKTGHNYGTVFTNTSTSDTASISKHGIYVNSVGLWDGGSNPNYAIYIAGASGGDTNWAIYNATAADVYLGTGNTLIGAAGTPTADLSFGGAATINTLAGALTLAPASGSVLVTGGTTHHYVILTGTATSDEVAYRMTDGTTSWYAGMMGTGIGAAGAWSLYQSGLKMTVLSTGEVGIRTASPTRPLSIKADSNGYNIGLNDSGDTERSWIYSNSTGSVWQTAAGMKLQLNGSNGTGLIVDNASNVGIGIAAPGHKLNVYGTGNTAIEVQGNGTASLGYLSARADGDPVIQMGQFGSAATGTTFGIANTRLSVIYTTTYATTHALGMAIGNTSDIPIYFATNQAVRFTIDGSSNTLTGNGASTIATSSGNLIFQPVGVSSFGTDAQLNGNSVLWNEAGVRSWTMGTAASTGTLTLQSGDSAEWGVASSRDRRLLYSRQRFRDAYLKSG